MFVHLHFGLLWTPLTKCVQAHSISQRFPWVLKNIESNSEQWMNRKIWCYRMNLHNMYKNNKIISEKENCNIKLFTIKSYIKIELWKQSNQCNAIINHRITKNAVIAVKDRNVLYEQSIIDCIWLFKYLVVVSKRRVNKTSSRALSLSLF